MKRCFYSFISVVGGFILTLLLVYLMFSVTSCSSVQAKKTLKFVNDAAKVTNEIAVATDPLFRLQCRYIAENCAKNDDKECKALKTCQKLRKTIFDGVVLWKLAAEEMSEYANSISD